MSWQMYVDQQLMGSGMMTKAVIAGHDGTIWAKSDKVEPCKDELSILARSFADQSALQMSGVTLAGEKFIYLSGTEKVIRCKKGKCGMHAVKTTQAILVGCFEEPIQHQQVANVVESLGEYLISLGY